MRWLVLCLGLLWSGPAAAHALRVFAAVEGDRVAGYGFFIGGGRPAGAHWTARQGDTLLAEGVTDAGGGFAFAAPGSGDAPVTVTIDAGDGHAAVATLAGDRFVAGGTAAAPAAAATATPEMIEAAVARQVAPLLERIEVMDARMRLTDLVAGLCLIGGIAGMGLWLKDRRR